MSEEKNTELNEEQLSDVVGGRRKRTFSYEFCDPVGKYQVQAFIGQRLWWIIDGKHYEAIVLNSREEDEGCGTVRKQTLKIVYDFDNKKVCNYTKVIEGDDGTAWRTFLLK